MPVLPVLVVALAAPEPTPPMPSLDPVGHTLAWEAPEACPTTEALRAKTEALLGTSLDEPTAQPIDAQGTVVKGEREWVLVLSISTISGTHQRRLEAGRCVELVDAAAVVIATTIDPTVGALPSEPEPTPEPIPEPEPAPEPTPEPTPESPPTWGGFARVAGGLSFGPLPSLGPAIAVEVGARRRWFRAELQSTYLFARNAQLDGVTGRIQQWSAVARACAVPAIAEFEFPLCAGPELGVMTGRSREVDTPGVGRALWAAANFGPSVVYSPIPRLGLGLRADIVVPLSRPGFEIENVGLVHRAGAVGVYAMGGIELRFP